MAKRLYNSSSYRAPRSGRPTQSKAPATGRDWKMFLDLFFNDEAAVSAVDVDIVDVHDWIG